MGKQKKKKPTNGSSTIALNKKARHDYSIDDKFEAGVSLLGWEVKSIRAGKVQLVDSYVIIKNGEVWLVGAHMTPLIQACTHVIAEPRRERKLLLNKREIAKLHRHTANEGHTCVCLALYWKANKVKAEIATVTGKKQHDKRAAEKERDWNKQKHRVLKSG
ncbi:SsrA-binding protein SmpB [Litoribacillus peritrichatus]|uniref:SsrA-binding protein n=1 Tax=Litoribacillus peritrichatus TaxID=718191 RepID=A0ABP7MVU2_9GAMM